MRKIKSLLLIAFAVVLLGSAQVKAANEVVAIDGASIRTATEELGQGLRFYAKLDAAVKENEHGFYVAYGIATPAELEAAIALAAGGDVMLNGKIVYHVEVVGVTAENEYSVVLLGIPEVGYFDAITVLPYVVIDEAVVLPEVVVTRSVGEVALNMASAGENPPEAVLNAVKTSYKRVGLNAKGQLEITDDLYELNHFKLGEEFAKDWNSKFGTTWTKIVGTAFHANAAIGAAGASNLGTDLSGSNLYKFFHDEAFGPKWGWVLEFIKTSNGIHPNRQITAVQGDGTDGTNILYHASHLNFSIANFFNQANDTGGYAPINYNSIAKYDNLANFNDKVYVKFDDYEYIIAGANFVMPEAEIRVGYNFVNYKAGEVEVNAGANFVVENNQVFDLVYEVIEYAITLYNGETELTSMATTYTIEAEKTLPIPSADGKTFVGWYDNVLLEGEPISVIAKGSTGAKVFYAKFTSGPNLTVVLNEGNFHLYDSREDMVVDFMADYNAWKGTSLTAEGFQAGTYGQNVFEIFTSPLYGAKWAWMRAYLIEVAGDQNHDSKANLEANNDGVWRGTIDSFLNGKERTAWPASADYTNEPAKNGFWGLLIKENPLAGYTPGVEYTMPLPTRVGYTFGGWYDNADFNGAAITVVPADLDVDLILYAKWAAQ